MSQAQRVIDTLTASGYALQQCEIAERTGDPKPSIRRTVKQLVADGLVRVADHNGYPGWAPRFTMEPATIE